jgi:hypothetical protein
LADTSLNFAEAMNRREELLTAFRAAVDRAKAYKQYDKFSNNVIKIESETKDLLEKKNQKDKK